MKKALWLLVLAGGCIEYEPASTLPPAGVPFGQPLEPSSTTDKLVQVTTPEVDILWVIDDSCSMLEEQTALSNNFPVFMDYFLGSGLDYHIGVTTTTADTFYGSGPGRNGQLREYQGYAWIDSTVNASTAQSAFVQMAVIGTSGSGFERGRDAGYLQLETHSSPGGINDGFVRDDATLHVVMISDEDDQSGNISNSEWANYLQNLKFSSDDVTASSIVFPAPGVDLNGDGIDDRSECDQLFGGETPGYAYVDVTNQVGGIVWSICTDSWADVLEQLGLQASGMKREYFLSELPVPGTIKVWVKEGEVRMNFDEGTDWVYEPTRNSIIFQEFVPNALSEVYVKYDLLGESDHI